jgi:hypothetical protein
MAGLLDWAVREAVTLAAGFIGPTQIEALRRCAADQDNLVAALHWAQAHDDEPAAVDVATALFQLWTVRGRHHEASAWARTLLHLDDPAARRRSAILHGRAAGGPLPHADRLAWLCVLIGVNAGNTGPLRLNGLVRRALRTLFAERPGDVSPRNTALASALPGLAQADPDQSLADAATLIAHPDPYVQGMGHFIRAVLIENVAARRPATGDAELAYRRFEAVGDHWGMGMAAHAAGHAAGGAASERSDHVAVTGSGGRLDDVAGTGAGGRPEEWLRRSERHLALVGAAEDARSTRVLLDTQLALTGDVEAERRLRAAAGPEHLDETDACQAHLGLAELAWRRGRYEEALAHADALIPVIAGDPGRTEFRVAVAVLHLWVAGTRPTPETTADIADPRVVGTWAADARAVYALRDSRTEVLAAHDRELLGTWALGGAELAAFRGDTATARELWALGTRVGTNVSRFFPQGRGERLAAALGDQESREPLLAEAGELAGPAVHGRVRVLMDGLLEWGGVG